MVDSQKIKSFLNYIPIIAVLLLGFVVGFYLFFGIQYFNVLAFIDNLEARFYLVLVGMGILGATMYCSIFWAQDMDEAVDNPNILPNIFDFLGYITRIIGGGVTGLIFYFMVLIGDKAIFIDTPKMRVEAALIISFCGGYFSIEVQKALAQFFKLIAKQRENHSG